MKVYVAFQEVPYEFGQILGIFFEYDNAYAVLKAYTEQNKSPNWIEPSKDLRYHDYHVKNPNTIFTNNYEYLEIQEWEIK